MRKAKPVAMKISSVGSVIVITPRVRFDSTLRDLLEYFFPASSYGCVHDPTKESLEDYNSEGNLIVFTELPEQENKRSFEDHQTLSRLAKLHGNTQVIFMHPDAEENPLDSFHYQPYARLKNTVTIMEKGLPGIEHKIWDYVSSSFVHHGESFKRVLYDEYRYKAPNHTSFFFSYYLKGSTYSYHPSVSIVHKTGFVPSIQWVRDKLFYPALWATLLCLRQNNSKDVVQLICEQMMELRTTWPLPKEETPLEITY